jgi:putative CRISPR-associated protein (TIGR02620 family)
MSTEKVVVTRHPALVEHLVEEGIVNEDTPVLIHASADDIAGKHVIGILPLHLAALAESVTVVPLSVPPELRGTELSVEQVREFAGLPATYVVKEEK